MKRCTQCGIEYPADTRHFYRNGPGLMGSCKWCHQGRVRATHIKAKLYCVLGDHEWEADGRGRAARACPEHYDRNALRRWRRAQDLETARAEDRRLYQIKMGRNPERIRHQGRIHTQRRRALKRNQFIENVDPQIVYAMHGGRCGICGEFIVGDFHVDHVIPLVKGGMHGYVNVQPAHPSCNLSKNDRLGV